MPKLIYQKSIYKTQDDDSITEQICQIRPAIVQPDPDKIVQDVHCLDNRFTAVKPGKSIHHSASISIGPAHQLPPDIHSELIKLHT